MIPNEDRCWILLWFLSSDNFAKKDKAGQREILNVFEGFISYLISLKMPRKINTKILYEIDE